MNSDPDVVIYHGGCWDGFASAEILSRAVNVGHLGQADPIVKIPAYYGMDLPDEIDGRYVAVADFSFLPDQMVELAERAREVVWLDHHKTAIDAMSPHMGRFASLGGHSILDLDRSGARIVYGWLHPEAKTIPWPVQYIEDRDLWRKALPDHDAVTMWIRSHEMGAGVWQDMLDTPLQEAVEEGEAMAFYHRRLVGNATGSAMWAKIDECELPLATCSYDLGSDVADLLIRQTGSAMAGYVMLNAYGDYQYGLRSTPGTDCSDLARRFGGGGHAQASGFRSKQQAHAWLRPVRG